jgi:hypothetical protein
MILRPRREAIVSRIRRSGALAAVAALAALAVIGPPASPRAAAATGSSFDQITGAGSSSSAVTATWKQGLLDTSNQPITTGSPASELAPNADRTSGAGPLSFMYSDFQNLSVTVSQTQDLANQGITVSWTGGEPTNLAGGEVGDNYLQMMECYGDSSSGPSPQDCEYGTQSQLGSENGPFSADSRNGYLCAAGATADPANPPRSMDGSSPLNGCDPQEPAQGASPPDVDPNAATDGFEDQYAIPFVPVDGCGAPPASGCPAYGLAETNAYFNSFNSNEVEGAITGSDGTGEVQFQTLTSTAAPGLGCGEPDPSTNQPRNCWLVIVPRGTFEPNGQPVNSSGAALGGALVASPLSASNWAMRIQVHLGYAAEAVSCPIGTKETETVGTQLIARAMQSWQLALNQAATCNRIFGYSAVTEAESTTQLDDTTGSGVGLAFTTIPIGSEAARDGTPPPPNPLPNILYAPVAVTATSFGFNINNTNGLYTTSVNLSPELAAKALTQVYESDIPDYFPNATAGVGIANPVNDFGPPWAGPTGNSILNLSFDGQFIKANPDPSGGSTNSIWSNPTQAPLAPMLTEDHSAVNQQIWAWIQGDQGASAWLNDGTKDNANFQTLAVDPDYEALQLGTPPAIDSFPRAYSTCLDEGPDTPSTGSQVKEVTRCSLDLLPYINNYAQAASNILTGIDPVVTTWDAQAPAPDGSSGWWVVQPPQPLGARWIWGISDTADLAADGLIDARLCNDAGTSCVGPSTASLTAAVNSAKPDSSGLLQVNPASPGAGGYPMTQVVYAAVPTNQPATALNDYADLIAFAAGAGQTPGAASGDLPPGYLPLPASLQTQAMAVVAQLRASASPSPSASSTGSATSQAPTGTGTTSLTPSGSAGALSSATPAAGPSFKPPSAQLSSARTPRQPVGAIRWLLLAVVIAGVACAVSGTVLRSDGVVRWLRRMRT